jgi:hypothetical protein
VPSHRRAFRGPGGLRALALAAAALLALALVGAAGEERAESERRFDEGFDHRAASGGFALGGAHRAASCGACHGGLEEGARPPTACVDCHQDPHVGELGLDCARCHTTRSFIDRGAFVRQHLTTRFPLTGAHATADCVDCHDTRAQGKLVWVNQPVDCFACHEADYRAARDPEHLASGFSRRCEECHTTRTFERARFRHPATFPLSGGHAGLDCTACHTRGVVGDLSRDCYSCHRGDYEATVEPNHGTAGYPTDCAACHDTRSWLGAAGSLGGP